MFVMLSRLFIAALWSPAGKGLTSWLLFVMFNCTFVTFPCGILVLAWYMIVSIPVLCPLSYMYPNNFDEKTLNPIQKHKYTCTYIKLILKISLICSLLNSHVFQRTLLVTSLCNARNMLTLNQTQCTSQSKIAPKDSFNSN